MKPSEPHNPAADPRPWEQPGVVRRDVESHRGGALLLLAAAAAGIGGLALVLGVGCFVLSVALFMRGDLQAQTALDRLPVLPGCLLAAFLSIVLSLAVMRTGMRDLSRMRLGSMDPAGSKQTDNAISLTALGLAAGLFAALILSGPVYNWFR
jgi:hypothetical protein